MLYQLEQGKAEEFIIPQCIRQGLPLPKKIENAPELRMGLEIYFMAYVDLSSCRPWGFSQPGPIPWDKIREYARVYRFSPRQTCRLESLCRRIDKAYLRWWEQKNNGNK